MKIEHLEERVNDYKVSIDTVVDKKQLWDSQIKTEIKRVLKDITSRYPIGWKVQELNWLDSTEAVNIHFDSFPPDLIGKTNQCPSYQFLQGGALVFTQSYSGDIYVFITFPQVDILSLENNTIELGFHTPEEVSEKLIIEKVDRFLKEMIDWEVPDMKQRKFGFQKE